MWERLLSFVYTPYAFDFDKHLCFCFLNTSTVSLVLAELPISSWKFFINTVSLTRIRSTCNIVFRNFSRMPSVGVVFLDWKILDKSTHKIYSRISRSCVCVCICVCLYLCVRVSVCLSLFLCMPNSCICLRLLAHIVENSIYNPFRKNAWQDKNLKRFWILPFHSDSKVTKIRIINKSKGRYFSIKFKWRLQTAVEKCLHWSS